MTILNELKWLGKYFGSRLDLVQAGGGNISIKDESNLYIKSSGCVLSEISETFGYSKVKLSHLKNSIDTLESIADEDFGNFLSSFVDGDFKRPSIEAPLHALMDSRVVVHIHPISVLALASQKNSVELVTEKFPDAEWIPYRTPGRDLAIEFSKSFKNKSNIVFLQNHGIAVGGGSAEEVIQRTRETISSAEKIVGMNFSMEWMTSEIQQFYRSIFREELAVLRVENEEFNRIFKSMGYEYSVICPDDVVYIGAGIHINDDLDTRLALQFKSQYGVPPKVLVSKHVIYVFSENIIKCRQVYEQLYSNVMARSKIKNIKPISQEEVMFLGNWEAEKYRQKLKG